MDTWLIAQCMRRLPPFTYFSHPEYSLEDFFSGETSTILDGNHLEENSQPVLQGIAPHELQFLRSLGQSLGVHSSVVNSRVIECGIRHDRGHLLPRNHLSDLASGQSIATSDEHAPSPLLGSLSDHRTVRHPIDSPSVPNLPFMSASADVQALATPSIAHKASCTILSESETVQSRITAHPRHNSSSLHQCHWEVARNQPCGEWIEGGSKEVWVHVRTAHGLKGQYNGWCHCRWGGCLERLKVSSLHRHLAKHLDIRWRCSSCNTVFARCDYARRHIKQSEDCRGAGCYTLGPES